MKKILTILSALLITASVFAQAPEKLSYQAVVRNNANDLVVNSNVGMKISILQGAEDGMPVYVETQSPTSNANGLISIEIGTGVVELGDFSAINWNGGSYFIKTETDPDGGANYSIIGTSQLLSVPYALHAKTADAVSNITQADMDHWNNHFSGDYNDLSNLPELFSGDYNDLNSLPELFSGDYDDLSSLPELFSGDYEDLTNKPVIPEVPADISEFNNDVGYLTSESQSLNDVLANGTSAGYENITELADPVNEHDAANKAYVDELENKLNNKLNDLELLLVAADLHPSKFIDERDGNVYSFVTIGGTTWMAENLRYLENVNYSGTSSLTDPLYYVYDYEGNDVEAAKASPNYLTSGVLYNWPAAMNGESGSETSPSNRQGICPTGWHLPSMTEWEDLIASTGYYYNAGANLKDNSWDNGNNQYGFSALNTGYKTDYSFSDYLSGWWTTNEHTQDEAFPVYLKSNSNEVYYSYSDGTLKHSGFSVRCIKD